MRAGVHAQFWSPSPVQVAIVGASETPNSIGVTLVRNMLDSGYKGKLFFVNPKHETVFGQQSYPSVDTIPQRLWGE